MRDIADTKKNQDAFLRCYRLTANVSAACDAAHVGRSTVYEWRQDDPEFRAAFEEAHEISTDQLEEAARRRALDTSDTLMIFLLKANRPEKYRDQHSVEIIQRYANTSDEELERLLARRLAKIAAGGQDRLAESTGGDAADESAIHALPLPE